MNQAVARLFGVLMIGMHVLVVAALILIVFAYASNTRFAETFGMNPVMFTLMAFGAFVVYVSVVGAMTTLVAMNETLTLMKKHLAEVEDANWQTVKAVRYLYESINESKRFPDIRA